MKYTIFDHCDLIDTVDTVTEAVSLCRDTPNVTDVYEGHTKINNKIAHLWLEALMKDYLERDDALPEFIDRNMTEYQIEAMWQEQKSWEQTPT